MSCSQEATMPVASIDGAIEQLALARAAQITE